MNAKAWWPRILEALAAAFLAFVLAGTPVARAQGTEPVVASVVLNGTLLADAQLVHREPAGQRVWLPAALALRWRMETRERRREQFEGIEHAAFCERPDRCTYDDTTAVLTMTLANADIVPLRVDPQLPPMAEAPPVQSTGGVLNYDLTVWHSARPGLAAFTEGRAYSPLGHGAVRWAAVAGGGRSSVVLAQALWQLDWARQGISLQAGSINVPDTVFGAGLALSGVRIGSNAGLQPGLSTQMRPLVTGEAERALRTDVLVDGQFRQTADVPYGPYRIAVVPPLPGRGEIELVTTDASGLVSRTKLPYYQAPQAMSEGSSSWSIDAGVLATSRRPLAPGQPAVLAGAWRGGLAGGITAHVQALAGHGATRLALAGDRVSSRWGVSSLTLTVQRDAGRERRWLGGGHEFLSRELSLGLRAEQAVGGCSARPAGAGVLSDRLERPCQRLSAQAGIPAGPRWSVAGALDALRDGNGRSARVASLNARWTPGPRSQLALSIQQLEAGGRVSRAATLTWTQPLGGMLAQGGIEHRNGRPARLTWGVQSLPPADGSSDDRRWQAYGSVGPDAGAGVRWTERLRAAEWRAEASTGSRNTTVSAGISGAVGVAEGRVFAARRVDDAFVVVEVGLPDLPVLLDNREVARTNAEGWAVVTQARSHQANNIGVDIAALPVQYAMPRDVLSVVPALGSGARLTFDLSDGGIALPVRDAQGKKVPAGAAVQVSSQRTPSAVTSGSDIFIERSDRGAEIHVTWSGQRCRFTYQPADDAPPFYRCLPV